MTVLPPDAARRRCDQLAQALAALRLNRLQPPWRPLAAHLRATALRPDGEGQALSPASGWPAPDEWLRVRVDHQLAADLRPALAPLAEAGEPGAVRRLAYLDALARMAPLPAGPQVSAALIEHGADGSRFEVVIDRFDLDVPAFVRWTLRLVEHGARRLSADDLAARAAPWFTARLAALARQPAATALALLNAEAGLEVESLTRGEVGPAIPRLPGTSGPALTASLTRASQDLHRTSVDDPLAATVLAPTQRLPFGLSHHRKWAVPADGLDAWRAWLDARGSRNLVYTYRT